MNQEIQSYSTQQQRKREARHFFIPDTSEFFLYIIIGFMVIAFIEAKNLWTYFNQNVVGAQDSFSGVFSQNAPALDKVSQAITGGPILQFLFWALFGIFIYIFYWFGKSLVIDFYNDFIIGRYYIAQINLDEKKYWSTIILRIGIFILSLVLFIGFLYAGGRLIYTLSNVFFSELTNFHWLKSSLNMIAAVLCTAILIHILIVVIRSISISWRSLR